jgi:substrate import-associated zinc metallohydrolase lipoprotein
VITTFHIHSCKEEEELGESIFDTTEQKRNEFDKWILNNYVYPYNIDFKYRMEDIESSFQYDLVPADMNQSIKLAKIVKYLWLEAYDEAAGIDFTRTYAPKMIHLIGSAAYEDDGTMLLGTAEGGMKVTFYYVNSLQVDPDFLNYYYFKTIHHEFAHILNQQKKYDPEFDRISEGYYMQGDWYLRSYNPREAYTLGFVSPYAGSEPREDFAEVVSVYVTSTPNAWNVILAEAEYVGAAIINQKLEIVKNYMRNSWGIDLAELRDIVQRRTGEVLLLDLDNL